MKFNNKVRYTITTGTVPPELIFERTILYHNRSEYQTPSQKRGYDTGIGCAVMLLFCADTSVILLAASLGILGVGLGGNGTIFMKVVLSGLPSETASSGTGTYGMFRDLAAPFGVAVFVHMFTNRVTSSIEAGADDITAAVNSIKLIGGIEVVCIAIGIFVVLLLPKIYKWVDLYRTFLRWHTEQAKRQLTI